MESTHRIPAFWAGAQDHAGNTDLPALALSLGGWRAMEQAGETALIEAGVDPARARAWVRTPPRTTRGLPLLMSDPRYPDRLRQVRGAPPVLCVEGDPRCLEGLAVAVVGTRGCTGYGMQVARHLGGALAAAGITVVSGLARGIDAVAHRAALQVGRTVAVLGHGLDFTAPPTNRPLRRKIVESGGLVVSGWPDDFEPRPHTFPARNRWISGLSEAVVVVEAPTRSGALLTAAAAADQGREVFAVPGPLGAAASRGCLELVAQGAEVVLEVEGLVARLGGSAAPTQLDWLRDLYGGLPVEDVARRAGRSTAELLAEISRLELKGEVVRLPGQRYAPGGSPR